MSTYRMVLQACNVLTFPARTDALPVQQHKNIISLLRRISVVHETYIRYVKLVQHGIIKRKYGTLWSNTRQHYI